jgi:hypothetical protein
MCAVWISEQTAIISLYSINWLVFFNREWVYLLRGTSWVFIRNSGNVGLFSAFLIFFYLFSPSYSAKKAKV